MSMILNLARIPGSLGEELLKNPESIHDLIYPDDESESDDPALSDDDQIDLGKSWHALHFLFTGTAWEGVLPAS
jgi:hypothetical protein